MATVTLEKETLLRVLSHLELIVPSLDRIGAAGQGLPLEEQERMIGAFVVEWAIAQRLGEIRGALSDLVDYDELEQRFGNIRGWRSDARKP